MLPHTLKRAFSFLMAVLMVFSCLPLSAYAAEEEPHDHGHEAATQETTPTVHQLSEAAQNIQAMIDDILDTYLPKDVALTPEVVKSAVDALSDDDLDMAYSAVVDLEYAIFEAEVDELFAEGDQEALYNGNPLMDDFVDAVNSRAEASMPAWGYYGNFTPIDGVSVTVSGQSSENLNNGTLTVTAKGSLFGAKEATVTVSNDSGAKAQLNFSYTTTSAQSFTIAGANANASGSYSSQLDAGASVVLKIKSNSGLSNTTATLELSDFTLTTVKESSNVTVVYDNAYGSVTVDGTAVSSGSVQNINGTTGASLVATAANGGRFLGWIDGDGRFLSSDTTYSFKPPSDCTVKAVFVGANSAPHFYVGSATKQTETVGLLNMDSLEYYEVGKLHLFDNLNSAVAAATASNTAKVVVLANSGTLGAGTYKIPAGVTLLIPFNDVHTMYTNKAQSKDPKTYTKPTEFRTLTMANGANLVVEGAMSVSSNTIYASGGYNGGCPTGPCSFVKMQGNSSITVNSGGFLYAYGYITGSGTVTANSGATVYECFQIMDFRGGTQSTDMKNEVFPLCQYYVQNIEVPLTLNSGANEYVFTTIYMSSAKFPSSVLFVGKVTESGWLGGSSESTGMFDMQNGKLTKKYDGSTDRLIIEMQGTGTLSNIKLNVGGKDIDSASYDLGITNSISVSLTGENTAIALEQDIAMLPGAEMTIGEGVTLTLGSGKNVFIYDSDTWGTYAFGKGADGANKNYKFIPLEYAPGRTYNRTEADLKDALILVNGTVNAAAGNVYTTTGGANITSAGSGVVKTKAGTQTETYQLVQGSDYVSIPITPAKLKNADGTFVQSGTDTYTYVDGFWRCETHTWGDWSTGECSVCGEKAISCNGIKLSIESEIQLQLKFTVHQDLLTKMPDLHAYVTEEANAIVTDGNQWDSKVTELTKESGGDRYMITQGIAAGEMTGIVCVQFKNGDTIIPVYDKYRDKMVDIVEKSVVSFAEAALAQEGETGRNVALCKGALTFGGYAQLFYGTHTGKLAYEFLNTNKVDNFAPSLDGADAELKQVTQTSLSGNNSVTATTQKLNLDSKIYIRTYFTLPEGKTTDDYSVTISGPTNNGNGTFEGTLEWKTETDGRLCLDIENVPPAYWDDTYTIVITDTTMTENNTLTVATNVLAWCARCVNSASASDEQKNMARAMYFYNQAADTYFTDNA